LRFALTILLAVTLLAGCASAPERTPQPRDQVDNFSLEARFALRVLSPGQAAQSTGGRLSWVQKNGQNDLLISNPLGIGVAEITMQPGHAILRTSNGEIRESDNPDQLIEEVTGQRLPVSKMADWLLGRHAAQGKFLLDFAGRPQHFEESGWWVDYEYETDAAEALPSRLTLTRDGEIELRLRIETWKDAP
jgi:outer membrane lipoprotein LolB